MGRDMLSEFGLDKPMTTPSRAGSGGVTAARPVPNYSPPVGPRGINDPDGAGIHGSNYGNDQMESRPSVLNRSPNGFTNHGNGASQGKY